MKAALNFSNVAKDITLLYELSLAVGKSLDLKTNCDQFLKTLMARKNLGYASVWIKKKHLRHMEAGRPVKEDGDSALLVYANPQFRVREKTLPIDHPIFSMLERNGVFSLASSDEGFSEIISEEGIHTGSFAIFSLEQLGFLKLYSMIKKAPFNEVELNQLKNVINKFTVALKGSISHHTLVREVAERTRAEEALRESEARWQGIVKNAVVGIYQVTVGGKFILANPRLAHIFGYKSSGEFLGSVQNISQLSASTEDRNQIIQKLEENDFFDGREIKFRRVDGQIIWVRVNARKIKDKNMGFIFEGFMEDISERKRADDSLLQAKSDLEIKVAERTAALERANEELHVEIAERKQIEKYLQSAKDASEAANRAKSDFLANMSHELRTPLNHIIGFTELVVDRNFGELNETQEEYLDDALGSSRHLLSLINDILDLSKLEAGKLELEPSKIKLKTFLENSLVMIKEKAIKHGIQLSTDIDGLPETITADDRKLKQILYNLLSNAVKFTPDGGEIHLAANLAQSTKLKAQGEENPFQLSALDVELHRDWVTLSVTDSGIGLKPEDLERIFGAFEQVESSANRKFQGTGLGLSLTRSFVELHGGRIWAESEGEGKGSRFSFILPA